MGKVVLISTYELGRQPFGLASPAAWLKAAGADVVLQDLAVTEFDPEPIVDACLVFVYVPMHTATRLAEQVLARVAHINPGVPICAYGLYAPMNADRLRALGATSIAGGEFEPHLVNLYLGRAGSGNQDDPVPEVGLGRLDFRVPDRTGLPGLEQYAHLSIAGKTRTVGYTEATRGCKHLCRHCPVVPVYGGQFRVVQRGVVLDDIRQQVALGAQHITFGDPDFLNGPAHALKIVRRMHVEFPELSYDVTVKIEHLRVHANLLPELVETGCVLVTSAVESIDDLILERFDKRHTAEDLELVVRSLREVGLALNPTFVAFTPWTTLSGYGDFLKEIVRLDLVANISPVQYSIRLLIPAGSRLLELDDIRSLVGEFSPETLAYPWSNPDPRVDVLHRQVSEIVTGAQERGDTRDEIFRLVWRATAANRDSRLTGDPDLGGQQAETLIPQMSEPWYCCAEPTENQFSLF